MNATTIERWDLLPAVPPMPPSALVSPAASEPAQTARLEVSRQGVWHAVALLDMNDTRAVHNLTNGVECLSALDPYTTFRVVAIADVRSTVMSYSASDGWRHGD